MWHVVWYSEYREHQKDLWNFIVLQLKRKSGARKQREGKLEKWREKNPCLKKCAQSVIVVLLVVLAFILAILVIVGIVGIVVISLVISSWSSWLSRSLWSSRLIIVCCPGCQAFFFSCCLQRKLSGEGAIVTSSSRSRRRRSVFFGKQREKKPLAARVCLYGRWSKALDKSYFESCEHWKAQGRTRELVPVQGLIEDGQQKTHRKNPICFHTPFSPLHTMSAPCHSCHDVGIVIVSIIPFHHYPLN